MKPEWAYGPSQDRVTQSVLLPASAEVRLQVFFRLSQVLPAAVATFRDLYASVLLVFLARRHPVAPRLRGLALLGGMLFGIDLVC